MLFVSSATLSLYQLAIQQADGIELRLDLLERFDLESVRAYLLAAPLPVMLTLRKRSQGGKFMGSEEKRELMIRDLLALNPPFFDLEGEMRPVFLEEMISRCPGTRFVLSHHDFDRMPPDLEQVYSSLSRYAPFCCKIAVSPATATEALRMLLFVRSHSGMSGICMGSKAAFARVLGKICGNVIDYANAASQPQTGPGQIALEDLLHIYRYPSLNAQTAIYGLIGNPVEQSPGHVYHNRVFQARNENAVYVKMTVDPAELETFLPLAKEIGVRGFSVTIPLKEKILPFLDEVESKAKQMGAVNTLLFANRCLLGINTDGAGALDAIEKRLSVSSKSVVLLGAGGAARAIAFEARWRGARITILNRTPAKAGALAESVGGEFGSLDSVPEDYDILINCSPDPMPIDASRILSKALVMDVVIQPKETVFLKTAMQRGCQVVYGEEMFLNQAEGQTRLWLDSSRRSFGSSG